MNQYLTIMLACSLGLMACSEKQHLCPCPSENQLDQQLMVLLASARAFHHQADIHLQQGEVGQAVEALRQLLSLKLDRRWPEAEEVRLDATARLAKLLLGQGQEQQALTLVQQELTAGARESFYLSNLHSVRGEILEGRARRLETAGDRLGGKQSAREAIAAFEQSIRINQQLQQRLLRESHP
jgi:tetratricopeptide (TPR) repeat protein